MKSKAQGQGGTGSLAACLSRKRGLLNYHPCIRQLVLGLVLWHSTILLLCRLAAVETSQDDYSSALGSQDPGDDVTSYSYDCLSGALDVLLRYNPHPGMLFLLFKCPLFLNCKLRAFYFLCGADLNIVELAKHAQIIYLIYGPPRDVLITLAKNLLMLPVYFSTDCISREGKKKAFMER